MVDTDPRAGYVLGHAAEELDRLARQARVIEPITRRILVGAGVREGMRVLDVGSGAGDVSFLAAGIVGASGSVVGYDRSPDAVKAATARARKLGFPNVSFRKSDLDELTIDEPFDAVVGRYVLPFQRDPAATLRRIAGQLPSRCRVAFHEPDWAFVRSSPPVQSYDLCCRWLIETLGRSGVDPHLGLRMPAVFASAGLTVEGMHVEAVVAVGPNSLEEIRFTTDLARTLLPEIERLQIAGREEVDIDRLPYRIEAEMLRTSSLLVGRAECGAWASVP
jgi:SAM-dependent methyltransferase